LKAVHWPAWGAQSRSLACSQSSEQVIGLLKELRAGHWPAHRAQSRSLACSKSSEQVIGLLTELRAGHWPAHRAQSRSLACSQSSEKVIGLHRELRAGHWPAQPSLCQAGHWKAQQVFAKKVIVSLLLWQSQPDKGNINRDIITTILRPIYMTNNLQKTQFTYFYPISLAKSWHHKNK
jgi:hypothetical protein